jgi:hypothetical protein
MKIVKGNGYIKRKRDNDNGNRERRKLMEETK